MTGAAAESRLISRSHRSVYLACYLLIFVVGLRRLTELDNVATIVQAALLLTLFGVLYAAQPWLAARRTAAMPGYFAVQTLLALLLTFFREALDNWALLFIVLSWQAAVHFPRRTALAWIGLFVALTVILLGLAFGLLSGLGRAAAYLVIGLFLLSFDRQYSLSQDAQAESQALLGSLQAAHARLQEAAIQRERLAVLQEHARISAAVHDSVGQKILLIQELAGDTCALLETDLPQAVAQIERLQGQTQSALSEMRGLIGRWRAEDF